MYYSYAVGNYFWEKVLLYDCQRVQMHHLKVIRSLVSLRFMT